MPQGESNCGEFPCIFPAGQGSRSRDEFAPDSPHRHPVCCCRDFPLDSRSCAEFSTIPRGFARAPWRNRTGDAGFQPAIQRHPPIFSTADFGGSHSAQIRRVAPKARCRASLRGRRAAERERAGSNGQNRSAKRRPAEQEVDRAGSRAPEPETAGSDPSSREAILPWRRR